MSPAKRQYRSTEAAMPSERLRGNWPAEEHAYLVWVLPSQREYLFLPEELAEIAQMRVLADFPDGVVYEVRRQPRSSQ
jgi:hypothetical protein